MSAPADYSAFRVALETHRDALPKRLKQCAEYFDTNPERIAFDTVAQVADAARVQPSTVMRFAKVLGFSGYSELQGVFRARYADRWPDYPTRLARIRSEGEGAAHALLQQFAAAGQKSIARLAKEIPSEALDSATECLAGAQLIHVAGFRRAFPVAAYLAYVFENQHKACRLIDGAGLLGAASALSSDDALLAISFFPYTQRTIELTQQAYLAGAKIVAISDQPDSPVFELAHHRLEVREENIGDFRTMAAVFALATTLAVAVGTRLSQEDEFTIANHKME